MLLACSQKNGGTIKLVQAWKNVGENDDDDDTAQYFTKPMRLVDKRTENHLDHRGTEQIVKQRTVQWQTPINVDTGLNLTDWLISLYGRQLYFGVG